MAIGSWIRRTPSATSVTPSTAGSCSCLGGLVGAVIGSDRRRALGHIGWLGRRREEQALSIEAQLLDALADVVQRAVRSLLAGLVGEDRRVPSLGELLQGGHVDRPVVQVFLDVVEVHAEETPVGTDRVATERHGPRLGYVLLDEGERRLAGVRQRDGGRADRL